jgi:carbon storage regulator
MSRLILTRRVGESIIIGDDVMVTVTECYRGQVKLAIDAPTTVNVDRAEKRAEKPDEG